MFRQPLYGTCELELLLHRNIDNSLAVGLYIESDVKYARWAAVEAVGGRAALLEESLAPSRQRAVHKNAEKGKYVMKTGIKTHERGMMDSK